MAKTCTIIKDGRADTYGRPLLVGQSYTGPDDEVFSLWQSGFASVAGAPGAFMPATQIQQFVIAKSNIPFLIMPGDGSANGCQFTGTAGGFTLSAAIIASSGVVLAGCYAYLPANFGGSSRPAGFYWTEFSSDTAGKVYANTYSQIGTPQRPTSNTEFTENLTGWLTAPTTEIVIRSDLFVAGGSLGKNGRLIATFHQSGSTSGTKNYRIRDSATTIWFSSPTSSNPVVEMQFENVCLDSHTKKRYYRSIGNITTSLGNGPITSVDTSVDQYLSLSLQQSTNVATPILESFMLCSVFGE